MTADFLRKFLFEDLGVKGSLVRLSSTWQEILSRARPGSSTRDMLGEALCAAALLTSNIKFRGSVSLQIQSGGVMRLLLGQCTHDGRLRGVVRMREENAAPLLQQAVLAINLEPENGGAPYQGIVEMQDGDLVPSLERYFLQSEQLETRFWLVSGAGQCSGLMLQRMPETLPDADGWNRLQLQASSMSNNELQSLESERLIHHLFNQENVRLFSASDLSFGCSCSLQKVSGMLHSLGHDDVMELIQERGSVEVCCEFCGQDYQFDLVDVARIFSDIPAQLPDVSGVH